MAAEQTPKFDGEDKNHGCHGADESDGWDTESDSDGVDEESKNDPPSPPPTPVRACSTCSKTEADLETTLSRCAKCKTALYCSRACQKASWPTHKPSCVSEAAVELTYQDLIDSYRLRADDDCVWGGNMTGIYAGRDPTKDFRRFLDEAEKRGVVPKWWSKERRVACEKLARKSLRYALEKSDVTEKYGNPLKPMMLRMMAEQAYGKSIW